MADNQYVYIICQSMRTGRVYTVVDNRDQIDAGIIGGSSDADDAISKIFLKK
jgi:hypothetical protein